MSKVRERENKKEKVKEWFSILEGKSQVVLSPKGYLVISPCLANSCQKSVLPFSTAQNINGKTPICHEMARGTKFWLFRNLCEKLRVIG